MESYDYISVVSHFKLGNKMSHLKKMATLEFHEEFPTIWVECPTISMGLDLWSHHNFAGHRSTSSTLLACLMALACRLRSSSQKNHGIHWIGWDLNRKPPEKPWEKPWFPVDVPWNKSNVPWKTMVFFLWNMGGSCCKFAPTKTQSIQ